MLPEKKASCMRTHSDEADHHFERDNVRLRNSFLRKDEEEEEKKEE